jgi:hypothetical protein
MVAPWTQPMVILGQELFNRHRWGLLLVLCSEDISDHIISKYMRVSQPFGDLCKCCFSKFKCNHHLFKIDLWRKPDCLLVKFINHVRHVYQKLFVVLHQTLKADVVVAKFVHLLGNRCLRVTHLVLLPLIRVG